MVLFSWANLTLWIFEYDGHNKLKVLFEMKIWTAKPRNNASSSIVLNCCALVWLGQIGAYALRASKALHGMDLVHFTLGTSLIFIGNIMVKK